MNRSDSQSYRVVPRDIRRAAAVLAALAGAIHLYVASEHFAVLVLFGAFFLGLGILQLAFAAVLAARPLDVAWYAAASAVTVGVVALWAVTRTVGLPTGAEPWQPEPVGALDLASTAAELAFVYAMFRLIRASGRNRA